MQFHNKHVEMLMAIKWIVHIRAKIIHTFRLFNTTNTTKWHKDKWNYKISFIHFVFVLCEREKKRTTEKRSLYLHSQSSRWITIWLDFVEINVHCTEFIVIINNIVVVYDSKLFSFNERLHTDKAKNVQNRT